MQASDTAELSATDMPVHAAVGQVTANLLKRIGMNVDLQESGWGTVIQRRSNRGTVDKLPCSARLVTVLDSLALLGRKKCDAERDG